MAGKNLRQENTKRGTIPGRNEGTQQPADQLRALQSDQTGAIQIDFLQRAVAPDGKVTDRGKIIEIRITRQPCFKFFSCVLKFDQLSVLQLELDLADLQFMQLLMQIHI